MRYWKNCGADRAKAHSIKINGSVLFSFSSIVICCWLCHKKWNCSIEHLYAFPETDFEQRKKRNETKRNNNTHKNLRPTIRKSTCVSFSFQFYSNHTIYNFFAWQLLFRVFLSFFLSLFFVHFCVDLIGSMLMFWESFLCHGLCHHFEACACAVALVCMHDEHCSAQTFIR